MSFKKYCDKCDESIVIEMEDIITELYSFHASDLKELHEAVHDEINSEVDYVAEKSDEGYFVYDCETIEDEYKFKIFMKYFDKFDSWEFENIFKEMEDKKYNG